MVFFISDPSSNESGGRNGLPLVLLCGLLPFQHLSAYAMTAAGTRSLRIALPPQAMTTWIEYNKNKIKNLPPRARDMSILSTTQPGS
jgi:hypothetical protein